MDHVFFYSLGFAVADGSLSMERSGTKNLTFMSTDPQILEDLRVRLKLPNPVSWTKVQGGKYKDLGRVGWSNDGFVDPYIARGLAFRKSYTQGPLEVPELFLGDYLRGFLDGDGSVTKRHDGGLVLSFAIGSKELAVWTQQKLNQFGKFGLYTARARNSVWYQVMASGRNALPALEEIYRNKEGLALVRKRDKAREFLPWI